MLAPRACSAAALDATGYGFDLCDSACLEQAIRKPIKGRSKVALRFTSTSARHPPIAVSAIAE